MDAERALPSLKDIFPAHILREQGQQQQLQQQQPSARHTGAFDGPHAPLPPGPSTSSSSSAAASMSSARHALATGPLLYPNATTTFRHYEGGPARPTHSRRRGGGSSTSSIGSVRTIGSGLGSANGHFVLSEDDRYSLGGYGEYGAFGGEDGGGEGEEDGEGDEDGPGGEKRRHECPKCGKKFNRPSSLKIHLNTHTGAKPFQCPFSGCGRTFNVSSNMRRHFRNHTRKPSNGNGPGGGAGADGEGGGRRNAYPVIDPMLVAVATAEGNHGHEYYGDERHGHGRGGPGSTRQTRQGGHHRQSQMSRQSPPTPPYTNEPGSPAAGGGGAWRRERSAGSGTSYEDGEYGGGGQEYGYGHGGFGEMHHHHHHGQYGGFGDGMAEGWDDEMGRAAARRVWRGVPMGGGGPGPYGHPPPPAYSSSNPPYHAQQQQQPYGHHPSYAGLYQAPRAPHQQPSPDTPSLRHLPANEQQQQQHTHGRRESSLDYNDDDGVDEEDGDEGGGGLYGYKYYPYSDSRTSMSAVRTSSRHGATDGNGGRRDEMDDEDGDDASPPPPAPTAPTTTTTTTKTPVGPYALRPAFVSPSISGSGTSSSYPSRASSTIGVNPRSHSIPIDPALRGGEDAEMVEAVPVTMPRRNLVAVGRQ